MVKITDLFSKEQIAQFKEDSSGNLKGPCPSCGWGSGGQSNSSGCIIFVETNTLYCFGSKTHFDFTETAFLLAGEISCKEGRQTI